MVILLMGVAGSGKTTIGQRLAQDLQWPFVDADDLHPPANIEKMKSGRPLDDVDRAPWLAAIRARIERFLDTGESGIVTCSALKQKYRDIIVVDPEKVKLVHLHGSPEVLLARMQGRKNHFMSPRMLDSQLQTLEIPSSALQIDIQQTPAEIAAQIRAHFHL
jgi:gluconokinase